MTTQKKPGPQGPGKRGRPHQKPGETIGDVLHWAAYDVWMLTDRRRRGSLAAAIRKVAIRINQDVEWVKKAVQRRPFAWAHAHETKARRRLDASKLLWLDADSMRRLADEIEAETRDADLMSPK